MSDEKSTQKALPVSARLRPAKGQRKPFMFEELGASPELASALRSAFLASFGHTAHSSQAQGWRCVRKFVSFLRDRGHALKVPLPATLVIEYRDWLGGLNHAASTCQSQLNRILKLINWMERNSPKLLAPETRTRVLGFTLEPTSPREVMSEETVKQVLRCCYAEIEAIQGSLLVGQRLLCGNTFTPEEAVRSELISELLRLGDGGMPSQQAVLDAGCNLYRRVGAAGGLRGLSRQIWMCPEAIVPFYIAILVQTSGNPQSILTMRRDCIAPHPLRTDLERVVWEKPRSGREQHAESPVGRKWSTPNLVRMLMDLNSNLLPAASAQHKQFLFLAYPLVGKEPAIPSHNLIHLEVKDFARRHGLPPFQLKDFRTAGAQAHHLASGTLRSAQKRLNHKSLATTVRYTRLDLQQQEHESRIRQFQGRLVKESMRMAPAEAVDPKPVKRATKAAETVFGFKCSDPMAGVAQGSRSGELCLQFHHCATCPGALIPLDDPKVVARLLAAFSALAQGKLRALAEGWQARYDQLYEPTRVILAEEILPSVSAAVRARAERLVTERHLPHLE